ncbi:MAG TPA: patatin-like phospholipase family protein [Bacteroidota bacterium]|nr:patatin-like phospholipase family protein [Bacteroidota bacterium]
MFLKHVALQFLSFALPIVIIAQTSYIVRPKFSPITFQGLRLQQSKNPDRPKVGLVLSGGGARGLAQIGVLRVLEKNQIPIDVIVGNSLGSVLGGLYASGYSTTQLESIAVNTDWGELLSFSEETKRQDLFIGQKRTEQEGFLSIRFEGLEPIVPSSISGGQRLSNFFSYLTLQALYHPNPSFDDLKIPFRAVATDLYSGKRVILDRGSLSEAMRASVTVPLLYSPLEKDSMAIVDGGLVSNIPVDVAKSLGCDVTIVVNSTSGMRKEHQLNAPWEIADQIMTIMMQTQNETQLKMADVVIAPESGDRVVSDFSGIDSLITAGERATEKALREISDLLLNKTTSQHTSSSPAFVSVELKFKGDSIPQYVLSEMSREIQHGTFSSTRVEFYVNQLYATGRYQDVYAEVTEASSPTVVEFYTTAYPPVSLITFEGNDLLSDETVNREVTDLVGSSFDYGKLQMAMENVLLLYRKSGYALARIDSVSVKPSSGSGHFHINEGSISQIRYEGNVRTKDYVIRREFPLDEGNVFNLDKAYQGIVNIKSTGLFDYVLLDVNYQQNQPIVVLKVKEKSSELLQLGLRADNEHNIVSVIKLRDANFRGAWEDLGIALRYGPRDRIYSTEYTINRIFHSYLTFNLQGYYKSRDVITYQYLQDLPSTRWERAEAGRYQENKFGWSMTFGSHFQRFGDVTAQLRTEKHQIISISGLGYNPEHYTFVALKLQSIIDTEDKFNFPTSGILLSLSYESALKTLGSDIGYGKIELSYETYLTPLRRHTIKPKFTFGFADETLPTSEQFSLGGLGSFFGLREDDSRGRQLFLINMEYRYSLPFKIIFETYLKARYDLGMISAIPQELKLNSFRHGIGGEIALDTPIGQASFGMGKSFYFREDLPHLPVSVGPLLFYFSIGPRL